MTDENRYCSCCGGILIRKPREKVARFNSRSYCDQLCSSRHVPMRLWSNPNYRETMEKRQYDTLIMSQKTQARWRSGELQNCHDMIKRRTNHEWTGLSDDAIRQIIIDPRRYADIGSDHGITPSYVGSIKRGEARAIENPPKAIRVGTGGRTLGSTHSEKTRTKISEANTGKVYSDQTIDRMRSSARKKVGITMLTHNGETHSVTTWAELSGLTENTVRGRLHRSWSIEMTLTTPSKR